MNVLLLIFVQSHQTSPAVSLADVSVDGAGTQMDRKYPRGGALCAGEYFIKQVITFSLVPNTLMFNSYNL